MNNNNSKFGSLAIVSTTGYFAEYREACAHHLSKLGWEVTLQENFKGTKSFDGILVIGISFYRYIPFIPGQFRIGINSEQMPLQGDSDWSLLRNRKRLDAISSQYDLVIEWSPSSYLHTPCHTAYSYLPYGSPVPSGKEKTEIYELV